eukprot:CAMPEP_0172664196 /NCGR_PEP_ID=MMETSP1074-20121228/6428_1 /TAXON_ID=2916 /ORGANISM="Ceratium fusus, Strain PA161109" /LENGTH=223 /DNA_ID=CAMNT_0013480301 /DNA_START=44 /DNA_END=715 /DNA_ORIENTATION=+
MVKLRSVCVALVALALCVPAIETLTRAFLLPGTSRKGLPQRISHAGATHGEGSNAQGGVGRVPWGVAAAGLALGVHVGLFSALRRGGRSVVKAAETAAEQRLFESVYLDYTSEYLKGPMYFQEDKLQGFLPDYPGNPMFKNGKMTSNATGNLKTFSSNELAFLSVLFFGIGLYGNIQFNYLDPQWAKVDIGENFNATYVYESFFLPISFFFHIAAYIQKQNGK